MRHIAELVRRLGAPLLVSAGNEVANFSRSTGKRHPLRDEDFATLGRLGYQAILPRERELYFGLEELLRQQRRHELPLVATNLYQTRRPKKGRPVFSRYLIHEVANVRVAILGVLASDLADKLRDPALLSGMEVRDPVKELTRAVNELNALPNSRPQLTIVLSGLEALNGQEVSQESADDLTASTELQLRFIELGLGAAGRYKLIPYVNGTFDTEFPPNVNQLTGKELSHQKELRLAAGAVTFPGAILEEIRLAGRVLSNVKNCPSNSTVSCLYSSSSNSLFLRMAMTARTSSTHSSRSRARTLPRRCVFASSWRKLRLRCR